MNSTETVPTVLEGDIGGIIPALPDTPESVQSVRSGAGCNISIKGVAVNGGSGWYFPLSDSNKSGCGKG